MEELYAIMRDFLEVEYHQKALLHLLHAAEDACGGESQEETRLLAHGTKYYLKALQEELKSAIHRMDLYIAEKTTDRQHYKMEGMEPQQGFGEIKY